MQWNHESPDYKGGYWTDGVTYTEEELTAADGLGGLGEDNRDRPPLAVPSNLALHECGYGHAVGIQTLMDSPSEDYNTHRFRQTKNPKDFYHIASHVAGKSPHQCVDHYYLLKRNGFNFKGLMATAVTGAESALSFTSPLDLPLPIACLGVAARFNHMGETAFASTPSPTLADSSPDEAPTKSSARTGRHRATNTTVASIDADHNIRFQNSCSQYKIPAPIEWSFDEQGEIYI
ncbi:hypothetical protein B0H14DRAFT_3760670 [Mycena olivaceomarginata]|nr:hypothetical protein B0H14DRAFT_3760670 [Mycena olivaceomarginata]